MRTWQGALAGPPQLAAHLVVADAAGAALHVKLVVLAQNEQVVRVERIYRYHRARK